MTTYLDPLRDLHADTAVALDHRPYERLRENLVEARERRHLTLRTQLPDRLELEGGGRGDGRWEMGDWEMGDGRGQEWIVGVSLQG